MNATATARQQLAEAWVSTLAQGEPVQVYKFGRFTDGTFLQRLNNTRDGQERAPIFEVWLDGSPARSVVVLAADIGPCV